jgi:hypothetical protein
MAFSKQPSEEEVYDGSAYFEKDFFEERDRGSRGFGRAQCRGRRDLFGSCFGKSQAGRHLEGGPGPYSPDPRRPAHQHVLGEHRGDVRLSSVDQDEPQDVRAGNRSRAGLRMAGGEEGPKSHIRSPQGRAVPRRQPVRRPGGQVEPRPGPDPSQVLPQSRR